MREKGRLNPSSKAKVQLAVLLAMPMSVIMKQCLVHYIHTILCM